MGWVEEMDRLVHEEYGASLKRELGMNSLLYGDPGQCRAKALVPGCFVPGLGIVLWVERFPRRREVEVDVRPEGSRPGSEHSYTMSYTMTLEGVRFPRTERKGDVYTWKVYTG